MAEVDMKSIANLGEIYAAFISAAYNRLIADGLDKDMAHEMAMAIFKDHLKSSTELAAKKNQTLQEMLMSTKGGSA